MKETGIARQGLAAERAEAIERERAGGVAGKENPMFDGGMAGRSLLDGDGVESGEGFGVFDEDGAGAGGSQGTSQSGRRVGGIEGGRDGAVGEHAEIGEVELEAGFGIESYDVAGGDAERMQSAGDFFGGLAELIPGVGEVGALAGGLMEGG